jgi:hypothetical protein
MMKAYLQISRQVNNVHAPMHYEMINAPTESEHL